MIQKKLFDIFCEAEDIEKTGINEGHNYTFIKESSVKKMSKELFKKHRVLAMYQVTSTSQMLNNCTQVSISYNFTDIDDQSCISGVWQGVGYRGDKGIYKAITGAIKSCLIHNLGITSGEDGDEELKEVPVKPDIVTQLEDAIEKKNTSWKEKLPEMISTKELEEYDNFRLAPTPANVVFGKKKRGRRTKAEIEAVKNEHPEPEEKQESPMCVKESEPIEDNKSFF